MAFFSGAIYLLPTTEFLGVTLKLINLISSTKNWQLYIIFARESAQSTCARELQCNVM